MNDILTKSICFCVIAFLVCISCLAYPIKSALSTKYVEARKDTYTYVKALKAMETVDSTPPRIDLPPYVDTGIEVPREGDFYVECEYVYDELVHVEGRRWEIEPYWTVGSVNPFGNAGFGVQGHIGYRGCYYYTQRTRTLNFSASYKIYSNPYSVRCGIIDNQEYLEVNGKVQTHELNGSERGPEGSHFFIFAPPIYYQNIAGTILGEVRLISNGSVVFDGLPCVRDTDGKCGFFDIANDRFCPAVGNIIAYEQ